VRLVRRSGLTVVLVGLATSFPACGDASIDENVTTSSREGIVGGTRDPSSRAVGYLVERTSGGAVHTPACTVVLVSRRVAVTAAQCVSGEGSSYEAVFDGKRVALKKSTRHPSFDPEDLENGNDVAVLVLGKDIAGVTPAMLGSPGNAGLRIVGHGRNRSGDSATHERRSLAVNVTASDEVSIRVVAGTGSPCSADGGAPLVRDVPGGIEVVGLLSFAEAAEEDAPACAPGTIAVATPLAAHFAWIRNVVAAEGGGRAPAGPGAPPVVLAPAGPSLVDRIEASVSVFDPGFYRDYYPELRAAFGMDVGALSNHWRSYGHRESRIGSPVLDVRYYLSHNADVMAATGGDRGAAILHFLDHGLREGRRGSAVFDVAIYERENPDLAVFHGDKGALAQHWTTYGILEGRRAAVDFDPKSFAANTPEIRDVYGPTNYRAAVFYFLQHQAQGN
jgi:hypothetical protein